MTVAQAFLACGLGVDGLERQFFFDEAASQSRA